MIVTRTHEGSPDRSRYVYDFRLCTPDKGWAQVDTSQDASYFGIWTNPTTLEILSYTEGDVCHQKAESAEEYAEALRRMKEWNVRMGFDCAIDDMMRPEIREAFAGLGLSDLLYGGKAS